MSDPRVPQRQPGGWQPPDLIPVPPDLLRRVHTALACDRERRAPSGTAEPWSDKDPPAADPSGTSQGKDSGQR